MLKGNLVRLNPATCFTTRNGGGLEYPLTHIRHDEEGIVCGRRLITDEEQEAWYASDASKGMNSAGESKLPPTSVSVPVHRGDILRVERARCRMKFGYGNPTGGWAQVRRIKTDEVFYIKRDHLEVVAR